MAINEVIKKWEVIQTYCIETDFIETQKLSKFECRIRNLHKFLQPFFNISLCLQREDPVGFLFIPFIGTCYASFKIIQESSDLGRYDSYQRQFAEGIVKSIEKRCQPGGGLTQYKGYGLFCAQSYLQPTINVTLTNKCITTAKETLRQWHKAFHPEVVMEACAHSTVEELISCTSDDECDDSPSEKRTKLTLDEILAGEGFKIIKKAGQQIPSASTLANLEVELLEYENLVRNASDCHTERTIMAFSVFESAEIISNLDDEMVTFWKRHAKSFPCLRVLAEVARCLPPRKWRRRTPILGVKATQAISQEQVNGR